MNLVVILLATGMPVLLLGYLGTGLALHFIARRMEIEQAGCSTTFKIATLQWLAILVIWLGVAITMAWVGVRSLVAPLTWSIAGLVFHRLLQRTYRTEFTPNAGIYLTVTAVSLVLMLVAFVPMRLNFRTYAVAGHSMAPNLRDGHYVIVDKLSYGWRDPLRRGDIVVYEYPPAPSSHLIGRVVGLPNETLDIRAGVVHIDGQPLSEPYVVDAGRDDFGPARLSAGEFFVLGDNRVASSDSRTLGPLSEDRIMGKAWYIYWPPVGAGPIQRPRY